MKVTKVRRARVELLRVYDRERCPATASMNRRRSEYTNKLLGICVDCDVERRVDEDGRPYAHFRRRDAVRRS